jgi:hypothetical protein
MSKEYINPNSLSRACHGFSGGDRHREKDGVHLWANGLGRTKNIVGGDNVLEQARQAFQSEKAMEAAGGTLKDVVALRIYWAVDYQAESGTAVGIA